MLEIPQRVEVLEKRVDDHTQLFTDIRDGLRQLEVRVDARFAGIDARFASLEQTFDKRIVSLEQTFDRRLVALEQKVDGGLAALNEKIDAGLAGLDQKIDGGLARLDQKLDQKIDGLRHEMTTHFRWTAGLMAACLASILAGMGGIIVALLR